DLEPRRRPHGMMQRRVVEGTQAARAGARDEYRLRVDEVLAGPLLDDARVVVAAVLDVERIVLRSVAVVEVAGAVRDEHDVPVAERVGRIREIEEATTRAARLVGAGPVDSGVAEEQRARHLVPARAAALVVVEELVHRATL